MMVLNSLSKQGCLNECSILWQINRATPKWPFRELLILQN